jgi:hypothetical protein
MKKYRKIVDETIHFSRKKGNGTLKTFISINDKGEIARYSLTYINAHHFHEDNGRVIGYDNCHGYHHRHYLGKEERINFTTYENIVEQFETEWRILHEEIKSKK